MEIGKLKEVGDGVGEDGKTSRFHRAKPSRDGRFTYKEIFFFTVRLKGGVK